MNNLNYCRQMVKQFTEKTRIPNEPQWMTQLKSHCIDLARASQKFILPDGGRLYDDPEFKALDETMPLCLPYPLIAIEFTRSHAWVVSRKDYKKEVEQPTKALLFARERESSIAITVVAWAAFAGMWVPMPEVSIPRTGYIDRKNRMDGYPGVVFYDNSIAPMQVPLHDYMDEASALLCMLNILQCNNVHIEKSEASKINKLIRPSKKALPFDTYHVLTINTPRNQENGVATGGHRSPREHLRRGHIRRLSGDRRIWVNAAVVAAGRGAGVVTKDYSFRCDIKSP